MRETYFDNAATTVVRHEVSAAMREAQDHYGNPASYHLLGQRARHIINDVRVIIANRINAKPNEIIFGSGGTESCNQAILGYVYANSHKGNHIISTSIEHVCVLNTLAHLEDEGYKVTYLPVDELGMIRHYDLEEAISSDTALISIMAANNEIGSIMPMQEIGDIAKKYGIALHVDAVQAIGHFPIDVNLLNIAMMSFTAHKLNGPKGAGALYVKENIKLDHLFFGAGQEFGVRSGTPNVQGIVGLGKAIELIDYSRDFISLKNRLKDGISNSISNVIFNGAENGLSNILSVTFVGLDAIRLIAELNRYGIYVSRGSACASRSNDPPHVLTAIGLSPDLANATIRFSFGLFNTIDEIDYTVNTLASLVPVLRR